ncbi:MAG: sigma-70 family RNA polymerase sigma factor [Ignavibacteria bacterium]|nr:sigma-70 family RNA polymerase sigma factor [Ignavibacteria bacterium]
MKKMKDENRKFEFENDVELIEKFKSGDKKAFNIIVLKYQKMVYSIARRMLIFHDDADEVAQVVFIKLYRTINQFRGESKLSTYLYRITMNYCLNHLKKRNIEMGRKYNEEDTEPAYKKDNALTEIQRKEKEKFVRNAIENLPPQQRSVFILRFYENLTYDEISEILGTSIGGLKANYFHAIKNIKLFFEKNNYKDIF